METFIYTIYSPFHMECLMENWTEAIKHRDMIRSRSISEYGTMLGIPISELAEHEVRRKGNFRWVDMCCGDFSAGRDLVYNLFQSGKQDVVKGIEAIGVDVDTFMDDPVYKICKNVTTYNGNVVDYILPEGVDLVTCLRGLRYVEEYLKQGALAVQNWYNQLPKNSLLVFDTYNTQSLFHERGDRRVMACGTALVQELIQNLGSSVQTYCTFDDIHASGSFVVRIKKRDIPHINLVE